MRKILVFYSFLLFFGSCSNYGSLEVVAVLPKKLKEVSGVEKTSRSNLLWMINDGGNQPIIYGINSNGNIEKTIKLLTKNKDWEDITSDSEGNIYVADFGNNDNSRKDLVIYKVLREDIQESKEVSVIEIKFTYPNQSKFPPKKKERFFDAESLIYFNNNLYVFTKSRVKGDYGKTSLYKIPATEGSHKAKFMGSFVTCNLAMECWVTAASISPNKSKVALLTHNKVYVFSDFKGDDFFNGTLVTYDFNYNSQKEGITFKDNQTLYITDEKARGKGGLLYKFSI